VGRLALDLVNSLLSFAELTPKSATLAVTLFNLAFKANKQANATLDFSSYLKNTMKYLEAKQEPLAKELFKKITSLEK
jgi:hypothetical protein